MTRGEAELVDQIILSSERILDALRASLEDVQGLPPLDANRIDLLAKQDRLLLDAFLRRFETAVEGGRRLFRAGLIQREEPLDGLSLIDVVNRAEKLHILDSATDWRAAMRIRNVVVHEYAMDAVSASGGGKRNQHCRPRGRTARSRSDGRQAPTSGGSLNDRHVRD